MIVMQFDGNGRAEVTIKPDPTWDETFANIPTAPGTQAEQARHEELRLKEDLTDDEEGEMNELFFTIYPQLRN